MSKEIAPAGSKTPPIHWGDGSYVVLRRDDHGGLSQIVRGQLRLTVAQKELVVMGGEPTASITAPGAERLNSLAGVSIISTPTVHLPDGTSRPNPFIELDEGGNVRRVHVRRIGLGHNPLGVLCAHDETLMYDVQAYWMIDVLKAIGPRKGYDGNTDSPPAVELGFPVVLSELPKECEDRTRWLVLPYRAGLGIALNVRHPRFYALLDADAGRVKFAERIAQSICRRNCILHHPAIGQRRLALQGGPLPKERWAPDPRWGIATVFGWQPVTQSASQQLRALAAKFQEGQEAMAFELLEDAAPQGHRAEIIRQQLTIAHDEDDGAAESEVEDLPTAAAMIDESPPETTTAKSSTRPRRRAPTSSADPETPPPPPEPAAARQPKSGAEPDYKAQAIANIAERISEVGETVLERCCQQMHIAPAEWRQLGLLKLGQLQQLLATANGEKA